MRRKIAGIILACFVSFASFSQVGIQGGGTGNAVADALVNNLVGQGVTYSNAIFTVGTGGNSTGLVAGTNSNNGYFTNGNSAVGISSGVILSTGNVFNAAGPNNSDSITYNWGGNGDSQIGALVAYGTYDACGLEFDFVPQSDVISFRYVFASEEYNEYVNTAFNDAFAFFISGPGIVGAPNIALIPGTSTPVTINNVNNGNVAAPGGWSSGPCTNCSYYVDTYTDANQEYDGHTTVLTATATVIPCQTYHMKLIVTDVADGLFDSSVFLESGSFSSPSISGIDVTYSQPNAGNNSNAVEGCSDAIITLNMTSPSSQPRKVPFYLSGLAGFNVDYTTVPDIISTFNTTFPGQYYVTIPAGSLSTTLQIVPINDINIETTEDVHISVQMNSCSGSSYQDGDIYIIDNSVPMVMTTSTDTAICLGVSTNVSANVTNGQQPFIYTWDPVASNVATLNVSPTTDQVYNVTVTDACGATVSDNATVVVHPLPTAEITGSAILCSDETDSVLLTVNLTGTAPWDLILSDGTNILPIAGIPSSFAFYVLPAQTTTYSVLSVNDINCTGNVIAPAVVTINPVPTATISGATTLCNTGTQSTTLSVVLTGNAPWTFILNDGAVSDTITGIVTSPYTVNVTPLTTTTYSILSLSDINCVGSQLGEPVTVVVNDLLIVDLGNDTIICSGSLDLHAGNIGASYLWNTSDTTESISVTQSGIFSVIVTDTNNCQNFDTVSITVTISPLVVNLGNDTIICSGTSINLDAGNAGAEYLWSTLDTIQTIPVNQSGTYSVTVSNTDGCLAIDSILVTVSPLPVVNLGNDTALCTGASLTLHAGNIGSSYFWSDSSVGESITVTQNGMYSVTVTDVNLCTDSDTISVFVSPMLPAQITGDTIVCNGFTTDYQIPLIAGHTYAWTVTGGTATILTNNPIVVIWGNGSTGTLNLIETDTLSGCSATANQLNISILSLPTPNISGVQYVCSGSIEQYITAPQNGHTFSWLVTGGVINSGANTNQISVTWGNTSSGTIYLTENIANSFGCSVNATAFNITIYNQPPNLQIHDPAAVCSPGTVNIIDPAVTAGSTGIGGMTYWADSLCTIAVVSPVNISSTGTYYISAFNSCGQVVLPVHVTVNSLIPTFVINNPSAVCSPDGADIITAAITSGSQQINIITYWSNYQASIPLLNPDSVTVEGTYYLVGLNACGSDTASVYVIIHPMLPVLLIQNPDSTCAPFTVDLTDSSITSGSTNVFELSYWFDSTATNVLINPDIVSTGGTYFIMAENACGSVIEPVVTVINTQPVALTFQVSNATCSDGIDGKVHSVAAGGSLPYLYTWNTIPVQTTSDINSIASGSYKVTVVDAMGCSIVDTAIVGEENKACLEIPSAFTPNADGSNDKWEFKNMGLYPEISVEVYNRWGALVFKSDNYIQEPWDGKYKGNDVPAGTYIYIIKQNNGYEPINGTLTVIR